MKEKRVEQELSVRGPDKAYVTIIVRFLMRFGWPRRVLVIPGVCYQVRGGEWVYKVTLKSKDDEMIEDFKARARHEIRKALRNEN